jgi:hypothetical protein
MESHAAAILTDRTSTGGPFWRRRSGGEGRGGEGRGSGAKVWAPWRRPRESDARERSQDLPWVKVVMDYLSVHVAVMDGPSVYWLWTICRYMLQ